VELPEDCLEGTFARHDAAENPASIAKTSPALDPALIAQAAARLIAAQRPVAVVGKGARWDDAYRTLQGLIETLDAPFVASPMGRGLLSDDHPLACTAQQNRVFADADVVLVVGARLNWTFRYGAELRADAQIIQIDPSPAAFREGPVRLIELCATAATALPALLAEVRAARDRMDFDRRQPWQRALPVCSPPAASTGASAALPTPTELARVLAPLLPRAAITILDGNVILLAAQRHIPVFTPLGRLTPGTNSCMGVGLPFAIGAAQACPQRPVVVITGDMALSMNFFEFETAVRHAVPFVIVLANNDGPCGMRRQNSALPADYGTRVLAYQAGIRYDEMARQLGVHTELVPTLAELPAAFARALGAARPALLQMQIDGLAD
jgi:2-hydroxyacyl-CoA lyase 1